MTAEVAHHQLVSVEDYLAGELTSDIKHEYLAGVVYAMAGASNRHEVIGMNLLGTLFGQLEGRQCRPFGTNTKVRVRHQDDVRFYYLDALVVCRQNPLEDQFQDEPELVFEVISDSTRRIDEQEKRAAYCSLSSVRGYVLFEQDRMAAKVWRRGDSGFAADEVSGPYGVIEFAELEIRLPLSRIYMETGIAR